MKAKISNIVFTKNRPLQLEGYLKSLYQNLPADSLKTYIIWKEQLFTEQYQQLFNEYKDLEVVREKEFSSDFLKIFESLDTKYLLFGIDDVVFFGSVKLEIIDKTFEQKSNEIFGYSLRLDKNNIGEDSESAGEENIDGEQVYKIDWTKGRSPLTRYPLELCATIYRTELVKKIIMESRNKNPFINKIFSPCSILTKGLKITGLSRKVLKKFGFFYGPNTLESWNCRWCQLNAHKLPHFLYFQKICVSALQINLVNITTRSSKKTAAENTVAALNEKYKQGYRLDIDYIKSNKPTQTHCGYEYFKLIKRAEADKP